MPEIIMESYSINPDVIWNKKEADISSLRLQIRTSCSHKNYMKHTAITVLSLLALFLWFSWNLSLNKKMSKSSFLEEENVHILPAKRTYFFKEKENPPSKKIIKKICHNLFPTKPPKQLFLNSLLKKLYLAEKKFPLSGDIANLQGRIFWYKIHLSNKKNVSMFWMQKWKLMALKHWQIAREKYIKNPKSHIRLFIKEWMPEKEQKYYQKIQVLAYTYIKNTKEMRYLQRYAFT